MADSELKLLVIVEDQNSQQDKHVVRLPLPLPFDFGATITSIVRKVGVTSPEAYQLSLCNKEGAVQGDLYHPSQLTNGTRVLMKQRPSVPQPTPEERLLQPQRQSTTTAPVTAHTPPQQGGVGDGLPTTRARFEPAGFQHPPQPVQHNVPPNVVAVLPPTLMGPAVEDVMQLATNIRTLLSMRPSQSMTVTEVRSLCSAGGKYQNDAEFYSLIEACAAKGYVILGDGFVQSGTVAPPEKPVPAPNRHDMRRLPGRPSSAGEPPQQRESTGSQEIGRTSGTRSGAVGGVTRGQPKQQPSSKTATIDNFVSTISKVLLESDCGFVPVIDLLRKCNMTREEFNPLFIAATSEKHSRFFASFVAPKSPESLHDLNVGLFVAHAAHPLVAWKHCDGRLRTRAMIGELIMAVDYPAEWDTEGSVTRDVSLSFKSPILADDVKFMQKVLRSDYGLFSQFLELRESKVEVYPTLALLRAGGTHLNPATACFVLEIYTHARGDNNIEENDLRQAPLNKSLTPEQFDIQLEKAFSAGILRKGSRHDTVRATTSIKTASDAAVSPHLTTFRNKIHIRRARAACEQLMEPFVLNMANAGFGCLFRQSRFFREYACAPLQPPNILEQLISKSSIRIHAGTVISALSTCNLVPQSFVSAVFTGKEEGLAVVKQFTQSDENVSPGTVQLNKPLVRTVCKYIKRLVDKMSVSGMLSASDLAALDYTVEEKKSFQDVDVQLWWEKLEDAGFLVAEGQAQRSPFAVEQQFQLSGALREESPQNVTKTILHSLFSEGLVRQHLPEVAQPWITIGEFLKKPDVAEFLLTPQPEFEKSETGKKLPARAVAVLSLTFVTTFHAHLSTIKDEENKQQILQRLVALQLVPTHCDEVYKCTTQSAIKDVQVPTLGTKIDMAVAVANEYDLKLASLGFVDTTATETNVYANTEGPLFDPHTFRERMTQDDYLAFVKGHLSQIPFPWSILGYSAKLKAFVDHWEAQGDLVHWGSGVYSVPSLVEDENAEEEVEVKEVADGEELVDGEEI